MYKWWNSQIILLVGAKLQVIITKMGTRILERGDVVMGSPVVHPSDDLFWFNRPRLILSLIHFVLFEVFFLPNKQTLSFHLLRPLFYILMFMSLFCALMCLLIYPFAECISDCSLCLELGKLLVCLKVSNWSTIKMFVLIKFPAFIHKKVNCVHDFVFSA